MYRGAPLSIKLDESTEKEASSKKAPAEVQLFRCGSFIDGWGERFEITPEILSVMKTNFDNRVRRIDLAIDYGHENYREAAAWIKDIIIKDNGQTLWASTQWTKNGAAAVENLDYRYLSPEFTFNYLDNETTQQFGPTLLGAGLTNRPVIKDMAPAIELSERKGEDSMIDKKEAEQLKEKLAEAETKVKKYSEAAEGLGPDEVRIKFAELKGEIASLKKLAEDNAKEKALAEKKAKFDVLLAEGKVCEAQREPFMENDTIKFAELTQKINIEARGRSGEVTVVKLSEEEKKVCEKLGLTEEDFVKYNSQASAKA